MRIKLAWLAAALALAFSSSSPAYAACAAEYGETASSPLSAYCCAHAGHRPQSRAVMTEIPKISPTLIVLSGLPGSGKTVLAESLSRALSVPIFSVDPIEAAMWRAGIEKTVTDVTRRILRPGGSRYEQRTTTGRPRATALRARDERATRRVSPGAS